MSRILLIEPDTILGAAYKRILEESGNEVVCSRHAQDALLQFESLKPELLIVELQMPGHGGIEFLYEIRSYPEWQGIPVIIHTLIPLQKIEGHLKRLKQLGADTILYKPATTLRQLAESATEILQPA